MEVLREGEEAEVRYTGMAKETAGCLLGGPKDLSAQLEGILPVVERSQLNVTLIINHDSSVPGGSVSTLCIPCCFNLYPIFMMKVPLVPSFYRGRDLKCHTARTGQSRDSWQSGPQGHHF